MTYVASTRVFDAEQVRRALEAELALEVERVRLLLAKPGSIKDPGALAVWRETLAELGFQSSAP